jgi:glutathione S-transferase
MTHPLVLVSHPLCPYVQRAAILLMEKGVRFERREIDLSHKPRWFLEVSPLGKTPVLLVDGAPIFESAVICEYLEDTTTPRLHPELPLRRAQHRSWMAFGSTVLDGIGAMYSAPDEPSLRTQAATLRARFEQIESELLDGPYFDGAAFSVVDAVFGPVFRYFDVIDRIVDLGLWHGLPKVKAWRAALAGRPSVRDAVSTSYPERLMQFLCSRETALGRLARASSGFGLARPLDQGASCVAAD